MSARNSNLRVQELFKSKSHKFSKSIACQTGLAASELKLQSGTGNVQVEHKDSKKLLHLTIALIY